MTGGHSTPSQKKRKRPKASSTSDSHRSDDGDKPKSEGGGFDLDNFDITDWADTPLGDPPHLVEMKGND